MTLRNRSTRQLTELQQAILDFVWEQGPVTADQVRESLLPLHPLKDSSVRTLLRRLEMQGYLTHSIDGKTYLYKATAPTSTHAVRTVRQLIERFWSGSAEQFIAGMVDAKILSAEELRRLARKVKDSK
jgi:BlaI family transcriptional regulator, penicillinase repressor